MSDANPICPDILSDELTKIILSPVKRRTKKMMNNFYSFIYIFLLYTKSFIVFICIESIKKQICL